MSTPGNPPPLLGPKYSSGQIAMLVIGGIMLLPGLCSILLALIMLSDLKNALKDPLGQIIFVMLGICCAISAVGVILIVAARKRVRIAR